MKTKDYFIPKMYRRLLVPSVFSSLGFAFADMADALVLGNRIGAPGLAAVSLCLPVFMMINLFMDALGLGGSIRFSQKIGEGIENDAVDCFNRIWRTVLAIGLFIGLIANVFSRQVLNVLGTSPEDGILYEASEIYMRVISMGSPLLMLNIVFSNFLRNDNNANLAAKGFLIGNATDIILNIVLVLCFNLGTVGAASATVIGSAVAVCIYIPGFCGKKANTLKFKKVKYDFGEVYDCFKNGFSTSVHQVYSFIFFLAVNRMLMNISGENGVAVFEIVYSVSFLIVYLINGASEAAQPLISTFSGEHNEKDCEYVLKLLKKYGLLISGTAALIVFAFAENITQIFGINEALIDNASYAVRIYCMGFAFVGLNTMYETYYQAKEVPKPSMFISTMRGLVVALPCMLFLSFGGERLIWLMFPVTELITLLMFLAYKKKCVKNQEYFDEERILRITLKNDMEDLNELLEKSRAFCEKWNADATQQYYVALVIEELCTSIVRNATKTVKDSRIRVTILATEGNDFTINILDNAVKFNPFNLGIKQNEEVDFDEVSIRMVKSKAKSFMYRRSNGFNSLVVKL